MAIDAETIESYFKQLDWPFQRKDEHNWSTGYKGDVYTFTFFVRTTDDWLYVYVPFNQVRINPAARNNLNEHLLRLNYRRSMTKFMVDDDDDVGLTVEIPYANLQVEEFNDALLACCTYADGNYVELMNIATNPNAVSSLKPQPAQQ